MCRSSGRRGKRARVCREPCGRAPGRRPARALARRVGGAGGVGGGAGRWGGWARATAPRRAAAALCRVPCSVPGAAPQGLRRGGPGRRQGRNYFTWRSAPHATDGQTDSACISARHVASGVILLLCTQLFNASLYTQRLVRPALHAARPGRRSQEAQQVKLFPSSKDCAHVHRQMLKAEGSSGGDSGHRTMAMVQGCNH